MNKKVLLFIFIFILAVVVVFGINKNFNMKNEKNVINKNSKVEDIVFEKDKVNIYFFWGNGCPHCEDEFEFFENLQVKYTKHINLYTFETWYNADNADLLDSLTKINGEKVSGVPTTFIGEKVINGFSTSTGDKIKEAILDQYEKGKDVYKEYISE